MQTRELVLTAAVIIVPLVIAMVVTLWSLEQVRYKRKSFRPPATRRDAAESGATNLSSEHDRRG